MSRWISSALCTAALVAVLFCLPFWGIRSSSSSPASIVSDTTVSNVRIVKRAPKQTPAVVQPVQNKNIPVIPAKPAETIPIPEQEEKPVEVSEQAEETSGEAVETVEATESSDEATAADVQGSAGGVAFAEDNLSLRQILAFSADQVEIAFFLNACCKGLLPIRRDGLKTT